VVLYGFETWSLTLRKEHVRKVFENRVLRRIFGQRMAEIIGGGWRKLHNEELHNLCSLSNIIRVIKSERVRWTGNVACIGQKGNAYRVLVEKPEGKKLIEDLDVGGGSYCYMLLTGHRIWIDNWIY
jgi:hypothetical protein